MLWMLAISSQDILQNHRMSKKPKAHLFNFLSLELSFEGLLCLRYSLKLYLVIDWDFLHLHFSGGLGHNKTMALGMWNTRARGLQNY